MTVFRCLGLLVVVALAACDGREAPAPKSTVDTAKSQASVSAAPPALVIPPSTVEQPVAQAVTGGGSQKPAPSVHELAPSVPVVPVKLHKEDFGVAAKPLQPHGQADALKPAGKIAATRQGADKASPKTSAKVAAKGDAKAQKGKLDKTPVKDVRVGKAKLDLSLPPDLVRELEPPANVITGKRKPLLPPMFSDKSAERDASNFELNGRLLSNEMQLQMRNESRRDVEGAALDFKFKQ